LKAANWKVDEGSGNNAKEVSLELAGASNQIYNSTGTSVLQYKKGYSFQP
jgi:hypothetical protein